MNFSSWGFLVLLSQAFSFTYSKENKGIVHVTDLHYAIHTNA